MVFAVIIMLAIPQVVFAEYGGEIKLKPGATQTISLNSYWSSVINEAIFDSYLWRVEALGTPNLFTVRKKTKTSCEIVVPLGKTGKATLTYWNSFTNRDYTVHQCEIRWDIIVESAPSDPIPDDAFTPPAFEPLSEQWSKSGNYDLSWYSNNKSASEFLIETNKQLAGLAVLVNEGYTDFSEKTIKLASDIDISGKSWSTIGNKDYYFKGNFDGQGHSITGMNICEEGSDYCKGLFSEINKSYIKNLTIEGSIYVLNPITNPHIGGLCGWAENSTIDNCESYVDFIYRFNNTTPGSIIGGLVGYGSSNKVRQCKYQGDLLYILENGGTNNVIYTTDKIGGLFGKAYNSYISFCENTNSRIHAFVTCESSGALSRIRHIGGIVGVSLCDTVLCCRNNYNIKTEYYGRASFSNYTIKDEISGISNSEVNKIINCYSIVDSVVYITPPKYTGAKFYGIGPNTKKACFHNSDCIISGTAITSSDASEGAYTSEQMKTKTFLDDLNTYSMLEMDEPVWVQGEDGYPINKYFYSPSAEIDEITVSPTATDINIGETKQLNYSVKPYNATSTVTWKSDNSSIATVSSSGLVKGIAEGKTTIRATTDNGKTASCEVTVKKVEAKSISLPSTKTVYIGETVTLTYTMTPSNATNSVTWKSADTDIATVSSSGVVTGKKEGSTNITVTTDNDNITYFMQC